MVRCIIRSRIRMSRKMKTRQVVHPVVSREVKRGLRLLGTIALCLVEF